MALNIYEKIGELTIVQNEKKFKVNIYTCNALAAFVYDNYWTETETGKKHHEQILYNFFVDEKHVKNMLKKYGNLFTDDVCDIKLNTYYKNSYKLIRILTKAGYKVQCYYNEKI